MKSKKLRYEMIVGDNWRESLHGQPIDIFIMDMSMIKEDRIRAMEYFAKHHDESNYIFLIDKYERIMETFG